MSHRDISAVFVRREVATIAVDRVGAGNRSNRPSKQDETNTS